MKGMYGGPRGIKGGDYLRAAISRNSGGVLGVASPVNGNATNIRKKSSGPEKKVN